MTMTMKPRALAAAAAFLAGMAVTPAVVAQTEPPPQPPGEPRQTLDECQFDPEFQILECPSQIASSTRTQLFHFVSDLGARISQQRQVVRDTEEEEADTAPRGPVLGGAASADGGIGAYGRLSTFAIADYAESDREATSRGQAYDQETTAAIFGFDYRISNSLFAGATFNYLTGDTGFGGETRSVDVDSYVLGFHGAKYWDNDVFLEGLFTLGQFDLETRRIDGFDLMRYDASPEGSLYSADLALGQVHSSGRWRVTPLAKLLYLDGAIDAYRENDPSGFGSPETFDKQNFDALNLELSLQTDYVVLQDWGVLIPSLKVAYHHEFSDRHAVRSVRFGVPFNQTTDEPDSNTAVVRVGASAQFRRGWSGFASYEKLFGHGYLDRDDVVLGVRYEFF